MQLEEAIRQALDWVLKEDREDWSAVWLHKQAAEPLTFDGSALVARGKKDGTRVVVSLSPARRMLQIFVGKDGEFAKLKAYLPKELVAQLRP